MSTYIHHTSNFEKEIKQDSDHKGHLGTKQNEQEGSTLRDISNLKTVNTQSLKENKNTSKSTQNEFGARDTLQKTEEQDNEIEVSMKDILESQKRLTAKYLLERTGCESLEEITQLILREENLYYFDDTPDLSIDQLVSLEYLAISHNKLRDVNGINKLVNLVELNINFNLIEDITPLVECTNLEKLYASNNKIKSISGIKDLGKLKCLGLFKNKLENFDEILRVLSGFPNLQELDLEENPCTKKFNYKYDLLYYIKIERLDGERVTQTDYNLAKSFKKEDASLAFGKQKNQTNYNLFKGEEETIKPTSALQRPSTAPGRFKKANFVDKLKEKVHFRNEDSMGNIPENVHLERIHELEQEVEDLKEKLDRAEFELGESKKREYLMKLENENLTKQLNLLKQSDSNKPKTVNIPKENKELKIKIAKNYIRNDVIKSSTQPKRLEGTDKISPVIITPQTQEASSRGMSAEGKQARRIVKIPSRQSITQKDTKEKQEEEEDILDPEIEELLIRNSLQISTLRSELRNFDFFKSDEKGQNEEND